MLYESKWQICKIIQHLIFMQKCFSLLIKIEKNCGFLFHASHININAMLDIDTRKREIAHEKCRVVN